MKKLQRIKLLPHGILILTFLLVGTIFESQVGNVSGAEIIKEDTGNSGGGGSTVDSNPGCADVKWHSSKCTGIGWRYYSVDDELPKYIDGDGIPRAGNNNDKNNIFIPRDNFVKPDGYIQGCEQAGGIIV